MKVDLLPMFRAFTKKFVGITQILNSNTVRDLLYYVERYYSILYAGGGFYKVTSETKTFNIEYGLDQSPQVNPRHLNEWSLGFFPYYLSQSLGELSLPMKAEFSHSAPENCQKLKSIFGQSLEFSQSKSQLTYKKSILNKRINNVDQGMLKIIRQQAENSLQSHLRDGSFLKKLKMQLIENITRSNANAETIARGFGLTLSTFKRKLVAENINFRKTKESVKNELAQELLLNSHASISDIAQKTGFSDQSSFTRFFYRCNKMTPQVYRKHSEAKSSP